MIEVPFPGFAISDDRLMSRGYSVCNAVVLFGSGKAMLSHFSYQYSHPTKRFGKFEVPSNKPYIEFLVQEFKDRIRDAEIEAKLVGGDYQHFNCNEQVLTRLGIPIIGEFIDGFNVNEARMQLRIKDVFVNPVDKRVVIKTPEPVLI